MCGIQEKTLQFQDVNNREKSGCIVTENSSNEEPVEAIGRHSNALLGNRTPTEPDQQHNGSINQSLHHYPALRQVFSLLTETTSAIGASCVTVMGKSQSCLKISNLFHSQITNPMARIQIPKSQSNPNTNTISTT